MSALALLVTALALATIVLAVRRDPAHHPANPRDVGLDWRRVGRTVGLLWLPAGLIVWFVSRQAGYPAESEWLSLVTGQVLLVVIGRGQALHGARNWILAVLFALAVAWLVVIVSVYVWLWIARPFRSLGA